MRGRLGTWVCAAGDDDSREPDDRAADAPPLRFGQKNNNQLATPSLILPGCVTGTRRDMLRWWPLPLWGGAGPAQLRSNRQSRSPGLVAWMAALLEGGREPQSPILLGCAEATWRDTLRWWPSPSGGRRGPLNRGQISACNSRGRWHGQRLCRVGALVLRSPIILGRVAAMWSKKPTPMGEGNNDSMTAWHWLGGSRQRPMPTPTVGV
jgi:hypothetical protein